jgi:hypothetical protein
MVSGIGAIANEVSAPFKYNKKSLGDSSKIMVNLF